MNQAPKFTIELEAQEMNAVMLGLQNCVNVPFSAGYLMALVNRINAQGQAQLQALAVQKAEPPADPEEPEKVGGTD